MSKKTFYILIGLVVVFLVLVVVRFASPEDTWICSEGQWVKHGNPSAEMPTSGCGDEGAGLANPASTNCVEKGGTSRIENKPDGSQFGVCYFEDNRQCEEWAFLRGDCPYGGRRITGYITESARYCAIAGGTYTVTTQGDENTEKGNCALPNGATCEADAYYNGTCPAIE
ncbi:MAG: DUF333 domain-containing protein [Patescibacteria group bacterium]|jgi:hypothetical protein